MNKHIWRIFREWIQAKLNDDQASEAAALAQLKARGYRAYEDGLGLPILGSWFDGEIKPGMRFIWNENPADVAEVTQVSNGEVQAVTLNGAESWNEEHHFRSMVGNRMESWGRNKDWNGEGVQ